MPKDFKIIVILYGKLRDSKWRLKWYHICFLNRSKNIYCTLAKSVSAQCIIVLAYAAQRLWNRGSGPRGRAYGRNCQWREGWRPGRHWRQAVKGTGRITLVSTTVILFTFEFSVQYCQCVVREYACLRKNRTHVKYVNLCNERNETVILSS